MSTQTRNALISFNAGEWTPKLDARVDLAKYKFACRQLENAIVESYGLAKRRPGMEYVAKTKDIGITRMIDFKFSETTSFALEFGHKYMRFFSNGLQVLNLGAPVEISTPYEEIDVFGIHYQQINDVVYLAHPAYAPYKLTRLSDTNWTLTEVVFDSPAFLDENTTAITLTPSATTGNITVASSAPLFQSGHVGAYFQITHDRPASSLEIAITADGTSATLPVLGEWEFRSTGTWKANIGIERSTDGTNWERVKYFVGDTENFQTNGEQTTEQSSYRIVISGWASGSGRAIISCSSSEVKGLAVVKDFTSSTLIDATVVKAFYSATASVVWREGAWSDVRGYPNTVVLHEQRVLYAATDDQALTVWASATGDYENFEYGSADDSAFSYTLAGRRYDAIQWMISHTKLLIGTSGDEWSISGGTGEEALTATNVRAVRQSSRGASWVQAIMANESALFVQRAGKKIREMVYTFEKDGYVTPDLSQYAEHMFESEIVQLAFQQTPFPVLWAVTANGELFGMSYEREQEVLAWHRHPTFGLVESVCVTPNQTTGDDDIWLVVKRTVIVAGVASETRYVEIMRTDYNEEVKDKIYADCAFTYEGAAQTSFTLARFAGQTVSILSDGAVVPNQQANATGLIMLPAAATTVRIGFPYETVVKPMRMDVDPLVGPTQGMKRRITEIFVRFFETLGCLYGDGTEKDFTTGLIKWREVSFRDTSMDMDSPPPLFTGEKKIEAFGTWEEEGTIILKQNQPLPWSVLAIIAKYEVSGR